MGPMLAAIEFMTLIKDTSALGRRLVVHLYGSLALTGRGHQTDRAIVYGFAGLHPSTLEQHQLTPLTKLFDKLEPIAFPTMPHIEFFPHRDILFHQHEWLEEHPN